MTNKTKEELSYELSLKSCYLTPWITTIFWIYISLILFFESFLKETNKDTYKILNYINNILPIIFVIAMFILFIYFRKINNNKLNEFRNAK